MFILSFLIFLTIQAQNCNVRNKGVNAGLANQLTHSLNQIRNQVATGQVSFEGSSSASNMNLMSWSNGYAKMAQACTEKCPLKASTCNQFSNYGVLYFKRHLTQQMKSNQVMEKWFREPENAKQLLMARANSFGCGKSEDNSVEYIVCYFDEKFTGAKQSFLPGPVGASCKFGRSRMYSGLCATQSSQTLVHQSSSLKHKKQQNKKHRKHQKKHNHQQAMLITVQDLSDFV